MPELLLILVLFTDPSGEPAAKAVAEDLVRLGGSQVQVVVGPDAAKRLEAFGVAERDLVVSPAIAKHLTSDQKNLVLIRLERRVSGGDEMMESRIWSAGASESHVAISGRGGDPLAGAISGILQVIGPRLPTQPGAAATHEDVEIAQLATAGEWKAVADRLSGVASKDPRQFYYLALAQIRLGQSAAASETLVAMRTAHPGHFLIRAAEAQLPTAPASQAPAAKPAPATNDGNTLRDAPAVKDDGGNVLR